MPLPRKDRMVFGVPRTSTPFITAAGLPELSRPLVHNPRVTPLPNALRSRRSMH